MRAFVLTESAELSAARDMGLAFLSGNGQGKRVFDDLLVCSDEIFLWKALNSISLLLVFISSPGDAETEEEHGEVHAISSSTNLTYAPQKKCMCIFHLESEGLYV